MIISLHNPRVQLVRKLQSQAKTRQEEQAFIVEGVRLAEEALLSGWQARQVLFTDLLDVRGKNVADGFLSRRVPVDLVSPEVMKAVSQTKTPQGILAVIERNSLLIPASPDFLLILDVIRDPGNLGTILRTAAAAGVQAVILTVGCADPWAPKVVRAGMGAHFHLPILSRSDLEIHHLLKVTYPNFRVYLADSNQGVVYTHVDFRSPSAIVIGGEAAGAGNETGSLANTRVHIPMPGGSESLNAAVATAILLFEVARQRAV
jgi:RNA methyltransferase, TrmH family